MNTKEIVIITFALAFCCISRGQAIADGDFESIASRGYSPGEAVGGWTVGNGGGIVILNLGISGSKALLLSDYLSVDPTPHNVSIFQVVSGFIPGEQYRLNFHTSGSGGSAGIPDTGFPVNVRATAGVTDINFEYTAFYGSGYGSEPWISRSVDFLATAANETITFSGSSGLYSYSAVDSISIVQIPEPSSIAALLGGTAIAFSLYRKKRA